MIGMNDGSRQAASGGHDGAWDDPDLPWRPRGRTALAERARLSEPVRTHHHRRHADDVRLRRDGAADPMSPWSREAIESPLPTIEQIRSRWRRELGLDASELEQPTADAPAFAPQPDGVPSSTVSGDLILIGLVVAALVAASLTIAWTLIPAPTPAQVASPALPAAVGEVWTTDLGPDALVAFGGGMVVAAAPDSVAAYDADDGSPLWTYDHEDGGEPIGVAVYDDIVVVVEATSRTEVTLTGLGSDGSVSWSRSAPFATIDLLPDRPIEYSRPAAVTQVVPLDPTTGEGVGPVAESVDLTTPDHYVPGRRDGELSVFDLRAGRWLSPAIGEFGLRTLAPVGEYLVGLTRSSDIIVYDHDRVALDQRAFVSDAFGDFTGRAELVGGVPGTDIGIVASGSSVAFDTSDGKIDVVWEFPGRVGTPIETSVGPVSVARVVDGRTGEINHALVDVVSGETIVVTDEGATREAPPTVVADGYIVAPAVGDPSRTLAAYDLDGGQRWSLELAKGADYRVEDGTLFVTGADGVVSAYR
jgi:outer membrane protein assembly factor BamB